MLELVNNFNKLFKYPKVKRGPSYEEKVQDFSRNSETLIDVFCNDEKKRSEIEKSFQLKTTESEYKFFEDQESLRQSKCVKVQEKSTPSELRFQQRCHSEALLDQPSTSNISENISLSVGWKIPKKGRN